MTHRKLWILLSLFLLVFAACDNLDSAKDDFSAPAEPNIRLSNSQSSSDGAVVVSCWTKGEDNVVCDVAEDGGQSTDILNIAAEDNLTIAVAGEAGAPDNLKVSVQSAEVDATGLPVFNANFNPVSGETFSLDFAPEGAYRVEITAYYNDIGGSAATHSEVFAVVIGQPTEVAVNPTATEDTNALSDNDSATATSVAATNEAINDAFALTAEFAITQTVIAESTMDNITATDADVPTEESVDVTETTVPEATEPDVPTATILPTDTTEPEPTATPTIEITEVPTIAPTQGLPTFVPPATRTPLPPGNTGAPQVNLRVASVDYAPRATTFCEIATDGSETCNDETVEVNLIQGSPSRAVNFVVSGARPQRMTYRFLAGQIFREVSNGVRTVPSNTYLFNLPDNIGVYIIEIEIFYANSRATYIYQAQIQ